MINDYCWITIGANGFNKENLEKLVSYNPKGIRINTGRSSFEWIKNAIKVLIDSGYNENRIYLDIGNNKPRITLKNAKLKIKKNEKFSLGSSLNDDILIKGNIINRPFFSAITKDDVLVLGDGEIECVVFEKDEHRIVLYSTSDGCITNHIAIGLKGKHYKNYYLSPEDITLTNSLLEEYSLGLIISFVERKENIIECKKIFPKAYRIMPKIESDTAYNNLDEIMQYSEWAVFGRGDFALSMGIEKIGYYQNKLLHSAQKHNCKVIVASGMLESVERNKKPLCSEVIDISNSYFNGATGIMLTNESGASATPFIVIDTLYDIVDSLDSINDSSVNKA